eukprot:888712-Pyramimonas_sp.AAC.1
MAWHMSMADEEAAGGAGHGGTAASEPSGIATVPIDDRKGASQATASPALSWLKKCQPKHAGALRACYHVEKPASDLTCGLYPTKVVARDTDRPDSSRGLVGRGGSTSDSAALANSTLWATAQETYSEKGFASFSALLRASARPSETAVSEAPALAKAHLRAQGARAPAQTTAGAPAVCRSARKTDS